MIAMKRLSLVYMNDPNIDARGWIEEVPHPLGDYVRFDEAAALLSDARAEAGKLTAEADKLASDLKHCELDKEGERAFRRKAEAEVAALKARIDALEGPPVGVCVLCGQAVRQIHDGFFEDAKGLRHLRCQEHARAEQAEATAARLREALEMARSAVPVRDSGEVFDIIDAALAAGQPDTLGEEDCRHTGFDRRPCLECEEFRHEG